MKREKNIYLELFLSTLYLSAFTFGGGYVIVTLMKERFVDKLHYIDEKEMLDLVAIAQSAPGPIAVNGAIVLGYKLAGIPGILVSILGTIIPPFVIISIIASFYQIFITNEIIKNMLIGMRAGVGAIICNVVYDMGGGVLKENKVRSVLIMMATFILNYVFNVNIALIVLGCIAIALIDTFVVKKVKA